MRLYRKTFEVDAIYDPTEAVPGRWVPWCVAHRSTQDGEHTWEAVCPEGWDADDCRWHPQGAFIPEVAHR